MVKQQFPPGWGAERVKALADYYDHQSDDEAIAEADAAIEAGAGGLGDPGAHVPFLTLTLSTLG